MAPSLLRLAAAATTALLTTSASAASCARPPRLGAVASETSICSQVGVDILRVHHGNAVDAAVATVLCNGVVAMYHSGIGGGSFALVRSAKGEYEFIDFREVAPAAATEDMYAKDENLSLYGGLARYVILYVSLSPWCSICVIQHDPKLTMSISSMTAVSLASSAA